MANKIGSMPSRKGTYHGHFFLPFTFGHLPCEPFRTITFDEEISPHIFVVVDAFSQFIWLHATKSKEVIGRLWKQAVGNLRRISHCGTAFTSKDFKQYYEDERIEHILISTRVPRAENGERINQVLIPLLTKLSAPRLE